MELLIQFIFKMIDNTLSTCKTICLSRGKHFLASLFAMIANYFYLITIKNMANSNSDLLIYVLCLAVFIGTYVPGLVIKTTKKDALYIFSITADTVESGKQFADSIRSKNIAVKTYIAYDSTMNKTLACDVYCSTKDESKVVESLMKPNFKYNVIVPTKRS